MHSFNLLYEPWIPVVFPDGTFREVGVTEALRDAHRITAVYDPAPVVAVALHRFLLALLGRIHPVASRGAWDRLAEAGRVDPAALDAYLGAWEDAFDLFHPERPFLQTPGLAPLLEARGRTVAGLVHTRPVGNNAVALMDDASDDAPQPLPAAAAARWLLATLAYGTGGLQPSDASGGKEHAQATPLLTGSAVLLTGATLWDTLRLNHLPPEVLPPALRGDPAGDRPAWEVTAPTASETRSPHGPLDYLTWRSRRVLLDPESSRRREVVRRALVYPGDRLPLAPPDQLEPMQAFRASKKGSAYAVALRQQRAPWRDLPVLLGRADRVPSAVALFRAAGDRGLLRGACVVGVETDGKRAKIYQWNRTDLPVSSRLLQADRLDALAAALEEAEEAAPRRRGGVPGFWAALEPEVPPLLEGLAGDAPEGAAVRWSAAVRAAR